MGTHPDRDYPADPYPGAIPPFSFVHEGGAIRRLDPAPWRVHGIDLDTWLAGRGAAPAAGRVPVLVYGSNRCPAKISWLRAALGLGPEPVVAIRVRTRGVAAVWASGTRRRDGQRPAVLAAAPGAEEEHAVWLATPGQVAVLDRCEGRDDRYRLARLRTGAGVEVRAQDGARIEDPWVYLGHAPTRRPLLVHGRTVRCTEVAQTAALRLGGEPGPGDGLDADTVVGAPHGDQWPAVLFTYGLLQPGQPSWHLVAPHAAGEPRPARLPGSVLDTGFGYPGWLPDGPGSTPGTAVPLRDPADALPGLDAYEGPGYRRVRAALPDGTVCWAYAWVGPTRGLAALPDGWPRPGTVSPPAP